MLHDPSIHCPPSKRIRELLYAVAFMDIHPVHRLALPWASGPVRSASGCGLDLFHQIPLAHCASARLPAMAILSLWPRFGNGGLKLNKPLKVCILHSCQVLVESYCVTSACIALPQVFDFFPPSLKSLFRGHLL